MAKIFTHIRLLCTYSMFRNFGAESKLFKIRCFICKLDEIHCMCEALLSRQCVLYNVIKEKHRHVTKIVDCWPKWDHLVGQEH